MIQLYVSSAAGPEQRPVRELKSFRKVDLDSTVGDWFAHPVAGPALTQGLASASTVTEDDGADALKMVESMPMRRFVTFLDGAIPLEALEELVRLSAAHTTTV